MCLLLYENVKQWNAGKSKRNYNCIYGTDRFYKRSIPGVIQSQCLKCRLECMMKVESQEYHKHNIKNSVKPVGEK
jgi:hypothetical protein